MSHIPSWYGVTMCSCHHSVPVAAGTRRNTSFPLDASSRTFSSHARHALPLT